MCPAACPRRCSPPNCKAYLCSPCARHTTAAEPRASMSVACGGAISFQPQALPPSVGLVKLFLPYFSCICLSAPARPGFTMEPNTRTRAKATTDRHAGIQALYFKRACVCTHPPCCIPCIQQPCRMISSAHPPTDHPTNPLLNNPQSSKRAALNPASMQCTVEAAGAERTRRRPCIEVRQ